MLPRLALTATEPTQAVSILLGYLHDESSIEAMQVRADLASGDDTLRARVTPVLTVLTETGTPAMRSRGRKLLRTLRRPRRSEDSAP